MRTFLHKSAVFMAAMMLPGLLLTSCSSTPDEVLIKELLEQLHVAAETKKPKEFLEHIAKDYSDNHQFDKKQLHRTLLFHFIRNKNVRIFRTPATITINKNKARAEFYAALTGADNVFPKRGRFFVFNVQLRKSDGEWIVYYCDWENIIELPDDVVLPGLKEVSA